MDTKPILEAAEGIVRGAAAILNPISRRQRERWGATDYEFERVMPGDELLPIARWTLTHAITIDAPPADVWPWVVQIGQGRGGFYSYESLEDMLGGTTQSAQEILEDFQDLRPGDEVRMHRSNLLPALDVHQVVPAQVLVLGSEPRYERRYDCMMGLTWVFYLEATQEGGTRLITRWRVYYDPDTIQNRVLFGRVLIEPITYVMGTKMLEGIRQRAEGRMGDEG